MSTFEHYSLENPSFIDAMDGFCYFSKYSNIYGAVIVVLKWRGYRVTFCGKKVLTFLTFFSLSKFKIESLCFTVKKWKTLEKRMPNYRNSWRCTISVKNKCICRYERLFVDLKMP